MRNVALKLMYNGTAYHGWQVQKTEITVAETLEKALATICGHPVKVTGCGRTDAGVHHPRRPHPPGGEHPPAGGHCGLPGL